MGVLSGVHICTSSPNTLPLPYPHHTYVYLVVLLQSWVASSLRSSWLCGWELVYLSPATRCLILFNLWGGAVHTIASLCACKGLEVMDLGLETPHGFDSWAGSGSQQGYRGRVL